MANKAISELPQAQNVNNQDLFVLEQSGIAKKLPAETFITEQGIINALAEALDGHGGIQSVTLSSVSGRIRTYLITFTDGSATTFQVYDGTTIERIAKTSTAGLVDTYTIFMNDGTTTFFTVTNGADGTVSEAMLNDALKDKAPAITETTESSAIANFTDGADDLVMHNVVAEINPVQSGSGDPAPDNIRPISGWTGCNVTRTGKNLLNADAFQSGLASITIGDDIDTITASTRYLYSYAIPARSGIAFSIKSHDLAKVNFYTVNRYVGRKLVDRAMVTLTDTNTHTNIYAANLYDYVRINIGAPSGVVADFANVDVQLEVGSSATAYEAPQVQTVTVDWQTEAGTVYGGTIDVATGLLTVDRANIVYNGSSGEVWHAYTITDLLVLYIDNNALAKKDNYVDSMFASMFRITASHGGNYDAWTMSGYVDSNNSYPSKNWIYFKLPLSVASNIAEAKAWAASNPIQVVYELATPQTYQLTGQEVRTLLGTNNVQASTGKVSVTYTADTKMFIEKLTMPTEDDLVANQAITSGKYFMIGNSLYLALANIASGAQITIGTNAQRVSLADALNTINS